MSTRLPPSIRDLVGESSWDPDGGLDYMRGWRSNAENSFEDRVMENTKGFDSVQQALSFANAEGVYSDNNSFFYTEDDIEMQNSEGFFQRPYCHRCITEADIEEMVSEIEPDIVEEDAKSFRPGHEKNVYRIEYSCESHPEVGISQRFKSFEKK
jgi:hypothetical protein